MNLMIQNTAYYLLPRAIRRFVIKMLVLLNLAVFERIEEIYDTFQRSLSANGANAEKPDVYEWLVGEYCAQECGTDSAWSERKSTESAILFKSGRLSSQKARRLIPNL